MDELALKNHKPCRASAGAVFMARMKPAKPRLRPARNAAPPTPARAKRITGNSLIAIPRKHFAKQPLCVACKADGRIRLATELDHITPLLAGGRESETNRQGLCRDCHSAKSAREALQRAGGG